MHTLMFHFIPSPCSARPLLTTVAATNTGRGWIVVHNQYSPNSMHKGHQPKKQATPAENRQGWLLHHATEKTDRPSMFQSAPTADQQENTVNDSRNASHGTARTDVGVRSTRPFRNRPVDNMPGHMRPEPGLEPPERRPQPGRNTSPARSDTPAARECDTEGHSVRSIPGRHNRNPLGHKPSRGRSNRSRPRRSRRKKPPTQRPTVTGRFSSS
jgi:hypothetical protein